MEKEEFVKKMADRLAADPKHVETILDASISEMFAPALFGPPGSRRAIGNNCGNGCSGGGATLANPQ
jgi:hypothetical protein